MIAYIEGKLVHKEPAFVMIDITGVGYHIKISLNTYEKVGEINSKQKLHTFLQIKEDAHTLFGFSDIQEKKIFLHLISVSGIGANTALIILSSLNIVEIQTAILNEDAKTIESIKGIGKKTAQRLILELKDKIAREPIETTFTPETNQRLIKEEALLALTSLGITKNAAEKQIDAVMKKNKEKVTVEELIKQVLKN